MPLSALTYRSITDAQMLPRLIRLGPNLYGAVFTLMKLVPAQYILRRALQRGELSEDTVIVETTSGTFGLSLAMQAALMERELILVSDPAIDDNLHRRLTDLGAKVEMCLEPAPVGGYQGARLTKLAEIRASLPSTFCPEQYNNPDNARSYHVVADQLVRTFGTVDCLVGTVGTAGSMCGTGGGLREYSAHTQVIGVDSHRSVLFGQPDGPRSLRGLGNSLWPANLDHTLFDEIHWCSAAEAYAQTRALHAESALFQGPTSGAAHLVAQWWAAKNPDGLCVVILPDEGYRYQATVYDDAWLAANGELLAERPTEPVTVASPAEAGDRWTRLVWGRRSYEEVPGVVPRVTHPLAERALS
ncbi:pyridoxal-phosphate dependent enzyme [Streptomyces sp. NPDC007875]|uniref:pyridoxal-phosphate dependent enzyme n=1 Tax=Streptomyces sp. NPDC007875 TaxID=3364783 RepID=UPI0036A1DC26